MKTTNEERDTFLTGDEVLIRTEEYGAHVLERLARATERARSERVRLLLESLDQDQIELNRALRDYRADAPDDVLDTYTQYAMELPAELPPPPDLDSVDGVADWIIDLNRALETVFEQVAELTPSPPQREAFEKLAEMVRGHIRGIARETVEAQDL